MDEKEVVSALKVPYFRKGIINVTEWYREIWGNKAL